MQVRIVITTKPSWFRRGQTYSSNWLPFTPGAQELRIEKFLAGTSFIPRWRNQIEEEHGWIFPKVPFAHCSTITIEVRS